MKNTPFILFFGVCILLSWLCVNLTRYWTQNQKQDEICLNNLKSLGEGFAVYAMDHEGTIPASKDFSKKQRYPTTWVTSLWPYIKDKKKFCCPAAESKELSCSQLNSGDKILCGYGMFFNAPQIYGHPDPLLADSTQGDIKQVYTGGNRNKEGFKIDKDNKGLLYTQLSFYQNSKGDFDPLGNARHGHNIHVLKGNGSVEVFNSKIAYIKK